MADWVSYFDSTYWDIVYDYSGSWYENYGAYWKSSSLHVTDGNQAPYYDTATKIGLNVASGATWHQGLRPTAIRVTYDDAGAGGTHLLRVTDSAVLDTSYTTFGEINEWDIPASPVTMSLNCTSDIGSFLIWAESEQFVFYVSDIEFLLASTEKIYVVPREMNFSTPTPDISGHTRIISPLGGNDSDSNSKIIFSSNSFLSSVTKIDVESRFSFNSFAQPMFVANNSGELNFSSPAKLAFGKFALNIPQTMTFSGGAFLASILVNGVLQFKSDNIKLIVGINNNDTAKITFASNVIIQNSVTVVPRTLTFSNASIVSLYELLPNNFNIEIPFFDLDLRKGSTIDVTFPEIDFSISSKTTNVGSLNLTFPSLRLDIISGCVINILFPSINFNSLAYSNLLGNFSLNSQPLLFTMKEFINPVGNLNCQVPKLNLIIDRLIVYNGELNLLLGKLYSAGYIKTGSISNFSCNISELKFKMSSVLSGDNDLEAVLPMLKLLFNTDDFITGILRYVQRRIR